MVELPPDMIWLRVADLAAVLGLRPQTIYNRLSTRPETLPPVTRIPGIQGPRWSLRIVRQWQAAYDPPGPIDPPRRRGRPTKAETIARRARHILSSP
jgi:hypothetical protein